jgi:hypothetical protein
VTQTKLTDAELLSKAAKRLEKWARRADRKAEGQEWHALHLPPNEHSKHSAYWVETVPKRGKKGYESGTIHTVADIVWGTPDMVYIALMQPKVGIALASLMKREAVTPQNVLSPHPELIYIARQILKTKYRKGVWTG